MFDLYPAQKDFSVDVIIEEYDYGRTDGSEVWRTKGTLHVGPNQRIVKSEELTVSELPRLASFLYILVHISNVCSPMIPIYCTYNFPLCAM